MPETDQENTRVGGTGIVFDAAAPEDDADLNSLIEEFGVQHAGDLKLKIYRIDPETQEEIWCFDALPSQLPLEPRLRQECPPGQEKVRFTVKVFAPNPPPGRGKSMRRQFGLLIAGRPAEPEVKTPPPVDIAAVLKEVAQQNANMLTGFAEQTRLQMENLLLKSGAVPGAAAQGGLTVQNLLELMPLIQQLSGGSRRESPMATIKEVLEISELVKRKSGGGDGGGDSLLPYLELIKDMVATTAIAKSGGTASHIAAPAGHVTAAAPGASQIDEETEGEEVFGMMMLKKEIKFLCKQAAANRETAVYANYVLDQVPESHYDQLADFLDANDALAVNNMAGLVPEVNNYREWFVELCGLIRQALQPAGELTPVADGGKTAPGTKQQQAPHAKPTAAGATDPD